MARRDHLSLEKGFSVLEAIVAAAILSAGIVGLQLVYAAQIRATLGIERSLAAARAQPVAIDIIAQAVREGEGQGRQAIYGGGDLIWQVEGRGERRSLVSSDAASGRFDLELVQVSYHVEEGGLAILRDNVVVFVWHETRPILPS